MYLDKLVLPVFQQIVDGVHEYVPQYTPFKPQAVLEVAGGDYRVSAVKAVITEPSVDLKFVVRAELKGSISVEFNVDQGFGPWEAIVARSPESREWFEYANDVIGEIVHSFGQIAGAGVYTCTQSTLDWYARRLSNHAKSVGCHTLDAIARVLDGAGGAVVLTPSTARSPEIHIRVNTRSLPRFAIRFNGASKEKTYGSIEDVEQALEVLYLAQRG